MAVRLVLAQQQHERELALADLRHRHEREPVPGRPEHELERADVRERRDEQLRIGADVGGAEAALEDHLAVVERADVERDRPGVDARDSGHTSSSLAISYTASVSRIWSLLSNSRRTQVLCTFIFGPPIASAPSTSLPS